MKKMSTILMIALAIAASGAATANAWDFSVGVCGADYYAASHPGCDLALRFSDFMNPDRTEIVFDVWEPSGLTPIGPSGSYELIQIVVNYATPLSFRLEVFDRTSGRTLTRGSVSMANDGETFEFVVAGRCDLAAVEPMETIYWIGPDDPEPPVEPKPDQISAGPADEDEGLVYDTLKSHDAENATTWGRVKAAYR